MIDLTAIRDRLRGLNAFASVSDVISAAAAMETSARPPAAFVAMASEKGAPSRNQVVHDQKIDSMIAVLMCFAAERVDNKRVDVAEDTRWLVMNSLTGWAPPGARLAMDFDSYRVVRMGDGLIWTELAFRTGWHLRKAPTPPDPPDPPEPQPGAMNFALPENSGLVAVLEEF